jgi:hypothetical protein
MSFVTDSNQRLVPVSINGRGMLPALMGNRKHLKLGQVIRFVTFGMAMSSS